MQPNINPNNVHLERDMKDFHDKCHKHLYQLVQVELHDGSVYQGLLHSYDKEKLFLIMPSTHKHHVSMHKKDDSESRQFFFGPFGLFGFPFFGIRRFGPFFPFFI